MGTISAEAWGAIIAGASTVVAVFFNILQLRSRQGMSATLENTLQRIGVFSDGSLLDDLVSLCLECDKAGFPLAIITDLAGYGLTSWPDKFHVYINAVKKRLDGGSQVSIVLLNDENKRRVLETQFAEFDVQREHHLGRVRKFVERNAYGRRALEQLRVSFELKRREAGNLAAVKSDNLNASEWVDLLLTADGMIMEDLRTWGATLYEYPYHMAVHLWIGQRNNAILALVDFLGQADERGFLAKGDGARSVQNMFESVLRGSKAL